MRNANASRTSPTMSAKKYISTTAAAHKANVSVPTIIAWCIKWDIGVKVAGRWRIDPDKLMMVLDGELN